MKISIKVKPNAKEEKVIQIAENQYAVWVKAPPKDGKANEAAVAILAEHFSIRKSRITILKGLSSRQKLIEIS